MKSINEKMAIDVQRLLTYFEQSQWIHNVDYKILKDLKIITREDLRNTKMEKQFYKCKTTGSTGEPVTIEKTYADLVWYMATNIRELRWRKWDVSKNIAIIKFDTPPTTKDSWGIPKSIEPIQGKTFINHYLPISEIQSWLEEVNPHYIQAIPSIVSQLDLSKITNLIDYKGTGEVGGSMYSSEECGTIAIQCPDNPSFMHVMENIIIEVEDDGSLIITCTTNPYIKRYKHGDHIELGQCTCKRQLQTIKKINGRVRNMFILPNGDKKWPTIGAKDFYDVFGIKRYKVIQTTINDLELHIISEPLGEKENQLIKHVQIYLNSPINIKIKYVDKFTDYKFEEFVSLV
jgi:phenylacetate-CoA ligase